MICPHCKVEMLPGKVLDDGRPNGLRSTCCGTGHPAHLNAETLELKDCLKCPKCGYSEVNEELQGK